VSASRIDTYAVVTRTVGLPPGVIAAIHGLDDREYYTDTPLAVLVPEEGIASPLVLQRVPEPNHA
jgi:hypothetical protein